VARDRGVPRGVDPRRSFLIAPFENQTGDPSLNWLREGSVNMLTLDLALWRDLTVADYERVLDLLRDENLEGAQRIGLEDARRLARRAGAWTVVLGQITRGRDSLTVIARAYDVASGRRLSEEQVSAPAGDDPRALFDRLARELLDLAGAPAMTPDLAKSTTSSLEAYRAYLTGVRALNHWDLAAADTALGHAIAADSTFALAYYKRSLVRGWWRTISDTSSIVFARLASRHAARLPERDRALVEAYLALTIATNSTTADTARTRQLYAETQRRFGELVARDSADAESWYGLGDALFHDVGGGGERLAANWTRSLRAFGRTLALDSTFHLAYSHRLGILSQAARQGSGLVLEGDSILLVGGREAQQRYGLDRIEAARARARELVVREARGWVAADPDAPESYRALADAQLAARDPAGAAATLRDAMQRPGARSPEFPYRIAQLELAAGRPVDAHATLREAVRTQGYDSLLAHTAVQRAWTVMGSQLVASYVGDAPLVEQLGALAARLDPHIPGVLVDGKPMPMRILLDALTAIELAAMGVPLSEVRTEIDTAIATLRRMDDTPTFVGDLRQLRQIIPAYAYIFGRDTSYKRLAIEASERREPPTAALRALDALDRGDTATATRIAAEFPRGDSAKARARPEIFLDPFIEAEVLATLGDTRGAIATYEQIDPSRWTFFGSGDPRWALHARSFLARGQLHEQLGERDRAIAAYERFLTLWKDARDPRLQPQLRAAREGLSRLRDAAG
jgi:tetratricopeptide (TPR) repeat protein